MAVISDTGITIRGANGFRTLIEGIYRQQLGADFALDPETPQGQEIGVYAVALAEAEEALIDAESQASFWRSTGVHLDERAANLGIRRRAATFSTVTATLSGTVGTTIPAGSRARTVAGVEFVLTSAVTIPAGGTVNGAMQAVAPGPDQTAALSTLTVITTSVAGWTGVTNPSAAVAGRRAEPDADFRRRYQIATLRLARSTVGAIRAALYEVDGVDFADVRDNKTAAADVVQGITIPAGAVLCLVLGGTNAAVARAIEEAVAEGSQTTGAVTVGSINFQRVSEVAAKVSYESTVTDTFPANGQTQIQDALVALAAEDWEVGQAIDSNALYRALYSVIGHRVTSLTVTDTTDTALPATPNLDVLYTLDAANVEATLT